VRQCGFKGTRAVVQLQGGCDGKRYPPKYVISIASKIAVRKKLTPAEFNGGAEANQFLRKFGMS
jgi:hypothetical protein